MSFSYAELSQTPKNTIPATIHTSEKAWKQALLKLLQITAVHSIHSVHSNLGIYCAAVHSSAPQDSKLPKPPEFLYD